MVRALVFTILLALAAPLALAQVAVRGLSHDFMQWTGPLAQTAPEDTKHFRTFMIGYIHSGGVSFSLDKAPLAGFDVHFTDAKDSPHIHAITPIFAPGEDTIMVGTPIGTPNGKKARVVGRQGYVVTGVALNHTGSYYAGMQVRFSKLLPDGTCELADSYASPVIGAEGGKLLEAKPIPFCGVHVSPEKTAFSTALHSWSGRNSSATKRRTSCLKPAPLAARLPWRRRRNRRPLRQHRKSW